MHGDTQEGAACVLYASSEVRPMLGYNLVCYVAMLFKFQSFIGQYVLETLPTDLNQEGAKD